MRHDLFSHLAVTVCLVIAGACSRPVDTAEPKAPVMSPAPPKRADPVAATPAPAPGPAAPQLSSDGYGKVLVGYTTAQVERVVGQSLAEPSEFETHACRHAKLPGGPEGLLVMFVNDRVARLSVETKSAVQTVAGLGLGATEARVRAVYGDKLEVEPHHYLEAPARYLTVWDAKEKQGIRYVTDREQRVVEIHAGDETIRWVEGCS